ncbi:MAG: sigma-54-dependent Fis family transcriptional regulator [Acidobacteria bacterium]|nr:sigma-54-dependent Fis family transcriptional regulator [Acidobacteriota bacterium]
MPTSTAETLKAPTGLHGESAPIVEVKERLNRVASSDASVLLTGESGVGKEVAARTLHQGHPRRRTGPFVAVHCGAIPLNLIESELFGHVRGSFTGAEKDREGRFEQAHGGTLFLDEVSTMGPDMQVKLLRTLQERTVCRVGGASSVEVDVRVIAASNQDLREMVRRGAFREDLYYRLNVVQISIPALRERPDDIPALARHFVERACRRAGEPVKSIPTEMMRALDGHTWPGNVRELENAMEAAVVLAGAARELRTEDLPETIRLGDEGESARMVQLTSRGTSLRAIVSGLERDLVLQSLRLARGNKAEAARLLGLKRTTFVEKMRRLDLETLGDGAALAPAC